MGNKSLNFETMVEAIRKVHDHLADRAAKAVNASLTLRNWLIGMYISEYEMNGEDKSRYGERLFSVLAKSLTAIGVSNCNRRQLYRYRDFYRTYPQIVETLSLQFSALLPPGFQVVSLSRVDGTSSPQSTQSSQSALMVPPSFRWISLCAVF